MFRRRLIRLQIPIRVIRFADFTVYIAGYKREYIVRIISMRTVVVLLLLPLCVLFTGCFAAQFEQMGRMGVVAGKPALGAWQGTWTNTVTGESHVAQAVVLENKDGTNGLELSLREFYPKWMGILEQDGFASGQVAVGSGSDGGERLSGNLALQTDRDGDRVVESLVVDATVNGDVMNVTFHARDAMTDYAQCTASLMRVSNGGGSVAASQAK